MLLGLTDDLSAVPEGAVSAALDALGVGVEADAQQRVAIRRECPQTIEVTQAAQC